MNKLHKHALLFESGSLRFGSVGFADGINPPYLQVMESTPFITTRLDSPVSIGSFNVKWDSESILDIQGLDFTIIEGFTDDAIGTFTDVVSGYVESITSKSFNVFTINLSIDDTSGKTKIYNDLKITTAGSVALVKPVLKNVLNQDYYYDQWQTGGLDAGDTITLFDNGVDITANMTVDSPNNGEFTLSVIPAGKLRFTIQRLAPRSLLPDVLARIAQNSLNPVTFSYQALDGQNAYEIGVAYVGVDLTITNALKSLCKSLELSFNIDENELHKVTGDKPLLAGYFDIEPSMVPYGVSAISPKNPYRKYTVVYEVNSSPYSDNDLASSLTPAEITAFTAKGKTYDTAIFGLKNTHGKNVVITSPIFNVTDATDFGTKRSTYHTDYRTNVKIPIDYKRSPKFVVGNSVRILTAQYNNKLGVISAVARNHIEVKT